MACRIWEVMWWGVTGEDFSGAESFLERDPLHHNTTPLSGSGGRWMEGGRAGTEQSEMMDSGPDKKASESSGVVSRGERSPSWGRWVSEAHRVSLGGAGLMMERVVCA